MIGVAAFIRASICFEIRSAMHPARTLLHSAFAIRSIDDAIE
jgi:hypothetical protein